MSGMYELERPCPGETLVLPAVLVDCSIAIRTLRTDWASQLEMLAASRRILRGRALDPHLCPLSAHLECRQPPLQWT